MFVCQACHAKTADLAACGGGHLKVERPCQLCGLGKESLACVPVAESARWTPEQCRRVYRDVRTVAYRRRRPTPGEPA
jgi:hypothetical protein